MIAAMTALYGVGQIAGPLIAGALYQIAASFNPRSMPRRWRC